MESLKRSPRRNSPAQELSSVSDAGLPSQLSSPPDRHAGVAEQIPMSASNSSGSATADETRNSGRSTGMRGGMSQFRAQPAYSRQRLRVKQYDPSKRSYVARNDDEAQKPDVPRLILRSEQNETADKPQEQGPRRRNRHGSDDYSDLIQHLGTVSPAPSAPLSAGQGPEEFTPDRLAGIVSFSITKCREKHLTTLGLAIKRLWQESQTDHRLSRLLGAVLSSTASDEEKLELQGLIANHKKRAKAEVAKHKAKNLASMASPSASPGNSKTPSRIDSSPEDTARTAAKSPIRRTRASARKSTSYTSRDDEEPQVEMLSDNGQPSSMQIPSADEEPRPKRLKRSDSVSSGSSLTPIPSDIDHDADVSDTQKATRSSMKDTVSLPLMKQDPKFKGPPKKVLGSFDGPRINGKLINTADEPESLVRKQKKQELGRTFDHVVVKKSHLRTFPESDLAHKNGDDVLSSALTASVSFRGKKKDLDDAESVASSAHDELLVPPPMEARRSSRSRQATPNARRSKNLSARVSARVKISPQKISNGHGGMPSRSSRSKELNAGYSDDDDDRENNDFCSACGSSGRLLCCDGCVRAFHFMCLDPPMDANAPPEGLWFCMDCEAKEGPYQRARRGIFSLVKSGLRKANTSAYSLPMHLREYYEGVATGDDGEYLDVPSSGKIRIVRMPGYDEDKKPDNTKLTDKKGEAILCFACGGSAIGKREIIACDYCNLYWHLDCLNPPLANPPFRDPQNRAKYRWMCPAHADSVINAAGAGGRLYKTRRPKNARIVDTQLRRGFKSNGIIEVELEESTEESDIDDEPPIYRVTEKSIRLDFNDRLRRDKEDSLRRAAVLRRLQERNAEEEPTPGQAYRARSFVEKQAVTSLVEMAKAPSNASSLQPDEIKEVIDALLIQAPEEVLAMLEPSDEGGKPSAIATDDSTLSQAEQTRQLILLRELISERLATLGNTICS